MATRRLASSISEATVPAGRGNAISLLSSAALWIVLAVAQGAMAAAVDLQAPRQSHAELTIPTGDPLSDPLVLSSAERRLFLDLDDGHLDEFSLLDAALVACGTADAFTLDRCRNVFAAVLTEVQTQAASDSTTLERVETIHRTLHERLLRGGYDANATDLAETLRTGVYNCASATVLWIALAKELNIDAHGRRNAGARSRGRAMRGGIR